MESERATLAKRRSRREANALAATNGSIVDGDEEEDECENEDAEARDAADDEGGADDAYDDGAVAEVEVER